MIIKGFPEARPLRICIYVWYYFLKIENNPAHRRKETYPLRDSQLVEVAEAPHDKEKHWMDPLHVFLSCLLALSYFQASYLFWYFKSIRSRQKIAEDFFRE
jgi:hypothetical protein